MISAVFHFQPTLNRLLNPFDTDEPHGDTCKQFNVNVLPW